MNKYVVLIVCILLCYGNISALAEMKSAITHPYKDMYEKVVEAGLPDYGVIVHDSSNTNTWYYYVSRDRMKYMRKHEPGESFQYGLWASENNGSEWKWRSCFSDFSQVLVQPHSSLLYATLSAEVFYVTDSDYLDVRRGTKIIVSKKGYNWTDITPEGGYLYGDVFRIFPDPDSKKGICAYLQEDGVMWQTSCEEPISWKKYTIGEWIDQHPSWDFDDMFPAGTVGKGILMEGEKIVEDREK